VGIEGQEIDIQITAVEYLRVSDHLFYDEALQTRYIHRVRPNDDPDYPRIAEVIEQLGPAERARSV
jgi:hypothetical protein